MQKTDEQKRLRILAAAGQLFAARPMHEVPLEDVAAAAQIGKGTLYVYFKSKSDLCVSLVLEGIAEIIAEARKALAAPASSAIARLERLVAVILAISAKYPYFRDIQQQMTLTAHERRPLLAKRGELMGLIEQVFRDGIAAGELRDAHPQLSALYVLGIVREVATGPSPAPAGPHEISRHLARLFAHGVSIRGSV